MPLAPSQINAVTLVVASQIISNPPDGADDHQEIFAMFTKPPVSNPSSADTSNKLTVEFAAASTTYFEFTL